MRNLAPRNFTLAGLLLLVLGACSTDTPTAPERTPAPPPGGGTSITWNISITAEPRSLAASDDQPATITIRVSRADNGAAPINGTTAVVSATLGDFNSSGSGDKAVVVSLTGGIAQLLYFAGELLGTDTIQAQLEASVGSAAIEILEADVLFIKTVAPNNGPQRGGTRLRISGSGFAEPARVTVGGINAVVDVVGQDADGEFIRAFTGEVLDPDAFFSTESCDTDGDGTLDGARYIDKTVEVTVQLVATGESDSLSNAFVYKPSDRSCRELAPDPNRPRARFSFTVNGTQVLFTNESSPPSGLTFDWIFGDGSRSTQENPVHNYEGACTLPGDTDFEVTLRVINASGEDTTTKTVTVTCP